MARQSFFQGKKPTKIRRVSVGGIGIMHRSIICTITQKLISKLEKLKDLRNRKKQKQKHQLSEGVKPE
ncbi:predicted protein [Sclerotinia sclerotiorum 1980 UF-70]|uniref:Uncharacterized protein n=1 Tax=Sclerotinia sclerotiorum (strain ATCC 18683 / 1980 / Ss-1) TaxID=665079 RepID=A7ENV5_SCLS1|nr:predicted protein [Sclerotinia sclerotiorum 1980 UF-70]EDO04521.1 predicted protein [Sclerotinia sclerotiorum 1980 UF-70]